MDEKLREGRMIAGSRMFLVIEGARSDLHDFKETAARFLAWNGLKRHCTFEFIMVQELKGFFRNRVHVVFYQSRKIAYCYPAT